MLSLLRNEEIEMRLIVESGGFAVAVVTVVVAADVIVAVVVALVASS